MTDMSLETFVPGGIQPSDHVYVIVSDNACSRCRREIREEEVPLMIWAGREGTFLWIYCDDCIGWQHNTPPEVDDRQPGNVAGQEAGGVFQRDGLTGAFGTERSEAPQ